MHPAFIYLVYTKREILYKYKGLISTTKTIKSLHHLLHYAYIVISTGQAAPTPLLFSILFTSILSQQTKSFINKPHKNYFSERTLPPIFARFGRLKTKRFRLFRCQKTTLENKNTKQHRLLIILV